MTRNQLAVSVLLARYDRLPDLYALARASGAKDVHAEQERLTREHDAQKKPYRLSMPYRNPGQPCKSGEHHVAMIKYTLVNPARNERAELWEAELHGARVHGEFLSPAVAELLGGLPDPAAGTSGQDPRSARVDQALRAYGDFGVYGDLRAGLQELRKDFRVTMNDVENGIAVSAVPRSGRGHEFFFVVNTDGTINPPMVGESEPVIPRPPQSLVFQFNHLRLAKQGDTISLTMEPVWQDAQRAPPPDFELGRRVLRMRADDFQRFWAELSVMDHAYYAQVTDADFETTPPDLRHSERLHYSVNGKEIVSWGRDYQWLRAELRAPLLDIQRQLSAWAEEQPAPAPGSFARVMLRDVEGLNGGQNVYVYSDGKVVVQRVLPAQGSGGLQERRYKWKLDSRQLAELKKALAQHPPRAMGLLRPGIPGEVQVEIDVIGESGLRITMHQWADGAQADFAALHAHLLRYTRAAEKHKPVHEGKYDPDWRPEATDMTIGEETPGRPIIKSGTD